MPSPARPTQKDTTMTTITDLDKLWTAQQCADYLKVKPRTWHGYVYRPGKRNPAPKPITKVGATTVWDPEAVRAYAAKRRRALNS